MQIPRTVASSIGTGLLAVLMVGVVTFGVTTIRPLSSQADAEATPRPAAEAPATAPAAAGDAAPAPEKPAFTGGDETAFRHETDKPKPTDEPKEEPAEEPKPTEKPKPTAKPTDKPKPTEQPKPVSDHLALETWVKETKVKLAWSKYAGDAFAYYKVVRSEDAAVSWPPGPGDVVVAAIGDRYTAYAADAAPCGHEFHYRVFAVRHAESGYKVVAASNTTGAFVKCAEEPHEPYVMGFDAFQADAGHVKLGWETCTSDGFVAYKVVRSQTNEAPSFPTKPGDELLAAIGDRHATLFEDGDVAPGETWFYRVYALGEGGTILGRTPVRAVTVE